MGRGVAAVVCVAVVAEAAKYVVFMTDD